MLMKMDALMSFFLNEDTPQHGLPAEAYTDTQFWQTECDTIFAQNWVFVGFAHSLSEVGDVLPVSVAGQSIILVKNKEGNIVSFHNVCRHRCLELVDKAKNVGECICCPYHCWTYHLNGELLQSPFFGGKDAHQPPGFEKKDYGLKPVRIAVWHDWIFVNLDGKAIPFSDYAKPLMKNLEGMDFSQIKPIATLDFGKISTNWKFIMENFIEPYHVQFVHQATTSQPLQDHYTIVDGVCLGSAVDLDEKEKVSGSLSVSSRYLTLFPNFIIGRYFPDQLGVYLTAPVDVGNVTQKRIIYTTEGQAMTEGEIEAQKKLWWDVHKEDHEICERLQLGRASKASNDGGVLSPHWECSVRAFQELVAKGIMQK